MLGDLVPFISWAAVGTVLQSLPPGIEDLIEQFGGNTSPTALALYGGSGLASIGAVRWLIKRRAAGGSSTGTNISTSTTGNVSTATTSGTRKHNVAFTLPSVLPISKGIREVTHNEIHALELGLVVGVVGVWLLSVGKQNLVYSLVIAFVAGSLGFKRYGSKAFKTLRLEAWYGLLALAAGGALGWALFIREPGLLGLLGLS